MSNGKVVTWDLEIGRHQLNLMRMITGKHKSELASQDQLRCRKGYAGEEVYVSMVGSGAATPQLTHPSCACVHLFVYYGCGSLTHSVQGLPRLTNKSLGLLVGTPFSGCAKSPPSGVVREMSPTSLPLLCLPFHTCKIKYNAFPCVI